MGTEARYSPDAHPDDFPHEVHEVLIAFVAPDLMRPLRMELLFALQAIAHRFCAAAEHDEDFAASVRVQGTAPAEPHRYVQQRELFEFFENGHAAIEASCYAAYLLGALVQPSSFRAASEDDRRQITPKQTSKRFGAAFPDTVLTRQLQTLLADDRYEEWSKIRNVLAHRLAPGRIIGLESRSPDGRVTPAPATELNAMPEGIRLVINDATTSTRRAWLARILEELLAAMAEFVSERFAGDAGTT